MPFTSIHWIERKDGILSQQTCSLENISQVLRSRAFFFLISVISSKSCLFFTFIFEPWLFYTASSPIDFPSSICSCWEKKYVVLTISPKSPSSLNHIICGKSNELRTWDYLHSSHYVESTVSGIQQPLDLLPVLLLLSLSLFIAKEICLYPEPGGAQEFIFIIGNTVIDSVDWNVAKQMWFYNQRYLVLLYPDSHSSPMISSKWSLSHILIVYLNLIKCC